MTIRADHRNIRRALARREATLQTLEGRQLLASVSAFTPTIPSMPTNSVLFANFDNGGEGVSSHDADRKTLGGDYRRKDIGVDIERNHDDLPSDIGAAPGVNRNVSFTREG